jgi:hypothetical protein
MLLLFKNINNLKNTFFIKYFLKAIHEITLRYSNQYIKNKYP